MAEQKLELQYESSTKIRTNINKAKPDCKYNPVKGINLVHYRNMIYLTKNLRKCVLEWYHCHLQHTGGDRLAPKWTTVCRWSDLVEQAPKLFRTCKDRQKFKKSYSKYGLTPAKDAENFTPWYTVCVDLIGTYAILDKVIQPDNKIVMKELQLLCMTFIDP